MARPWQDHDYSRKFLGSLVKQAIQYRKDTVLSPKNPNQCTEQLRTRMEQHQNSWIFWLFWLEELTKHETVYTIFDGYDEVDFSVPRTYLLGRAVKFA